MTNNFELLRNKEIIAILDGDKEFGEYNKIKIRMPYLSCLDICAISSLFGLPETYSWSGGALSRWQYMDNLIKFCIEKNKMSQLLSYLFSKDKFVDLLKGLSPEDIEDTYSYIVQKIMEQINGILYFGGNELIVIGRQYIIKKIGTIVKIETPTIKIIDRDYIKGLSERAIKDIDEHNYDSAITKARTILEETFYYVIEQKGVEPVESGDIGKLYGQVKHLYNMHADKDMDRRINMLLSGLEKIISSIAEMRNKESDSHGVGSKRIGISDYHARLFVNASVMMADFILSVYKNSLSVK
ncbi:MAG: abortive infection family protein [Clostridiales bacterium]|nr:abortive infection family protein [Clostridiales bacterium]